jgi:hypothetical protein
MVDVFIDLEDILFSDQAPWNVIAGDSETSGSL